LPPRVALLGSGLRTYLGTQNFPSAPTETRNALSLRDVQGRERARMIVTQEGTPSLEFLDSAGNVTHRYPQ